MEKIKLVCRIMDPLNGGVFWGEPLKVEISSDEEMEDVEVAKLVNRATYEAITEEDLPEDQLFAIGTVARASGDCHDGVCWVDSEGHQGGTCVLIEWHEAAA
jgi:hypothetical protein